MTGKQLAAVSLLSAVVAAGASAVTGCSRAEVGDVAGGKTRFDVTSLEFKDNASRPLSETDLPQWVQDDVHSKFPNGTVTGAEERKYRGGQVYYRVHVASGAGESRVEKAVDYNSGAGR